MHKAILSITAVTAMTLALALAGSGQAMPAAKSQGRAARQYQIAIGNFSFGPATLTVPAGTAVTWINKDDVPHIVASKNGKEIKSPVLDTDDKFTYTFEKKGTYEYYCSIHPMMIGKVIVR